MQVLSAPLSSPPSDTSGKAAGQKILGDKPQSDADVMRDDVTGEDSFGAVFQEAEDPLAEPATVENADLSKIKGGEEAPLETDQEIDLRSQSNDEAVDPRAAQPQTSAISPDHPAATPSPAATRTQAVETAPVVPTGPHRADTKTRVSEARLDDVVRRGSEGQSEVQYGMARTRDVLEPPGSPRDDRLDAKAEPAVPKKPVARHILETVLSAATTQPDSKVPQAGVAKTIPQDTPVRMMQTRALQPDATKPASIATAKIILPQTDAQAAPLTRFELARRDDGDVRVPSAPDAPKPTHTVAAPKSPQTAQPQIFALADMAPEAQSEVLSKLQNTPLEVISWDVRGAAAASGGPSAVITTAARAELPPQLAQQIAAALHKGGGDKPIEIALNPPELGRVRMVLTASESGMVVQVLTDRSETLDLMRRNIDDLGNALSDLGYEDLSFAFGQDGADTDDAPDNQTDQSEILALSIEDTPRQPPMTPTRLALGSDGIDIRL